MTFCQFWGFNCPQASSRLACQRICPFSVSASEIEPTPQLHVLFRSPDAMISSRAGVFCCVDSACYYTHRVWMNLAPTSSVKSAVTTSALHQRAGVTLECTDLKEAPRAAFPHAALGLRQPVEERCNVP